MALSRIYRGEHHPIDTIAGLGLGVAALGAAIFVIQVWSSRAKRVPRTGSPPARTGSGSGRAVTSIAVVAHQKKSLGGGLGELRQPLADRGFSDPIWYEVAKSRKAPAMARRAVKDGADLLLLWGGDGTVQRCIDALAGSNVAIAILPAGTANLLASNLGLPMDLPGRCRSHSTAPGVAGRGSAQR